MAGSNPAPTQAEREAADWFATLNSRRVTTAALEAFFAWRRVPANDEAYTRMEEIWEAGERLRRDPVTVRHVAEALGRGARQRSRRAMWRWLLPAGALALAGGGVFYVTRLAGVQTYDTAVGEQRLVALADGSRVRLDTDTALKVRFKPGERDLQLIRGRAFFDVAHDAARPFVVEADGVRVRAVGTRFDVRLTAGRPQVTLVEGAVEVNQSRGSTARRWRLAPGQALAPEAPSPTPMRVDVATTTSWTSGQLVFHATPLGEAVAEVNRYSKTKIVLENPALADRPVSGKFDVGDTQAFVSAVCALFDLAPTSSEQQIRLQSRAEPGV